MDFIEDVIFPWKSEYDLLPRSTKKPHTFSFDNPFFGSVDAEVLYAFIRATEPPEIVEVGAGYSTLLIKRAIEATGASIDHRVYDPNPRAPVSTIRRSPTVQEMLVGPGGLLFIDGSHKFEAGSDVEKALLAMNDLPVGAFAHFHDYFWPDPYPWHDRSYNEQAYVSAYLEMHPEWKTVFEAHTLHRDAPAVLEQLFASYAGVGPAGPGSLWLMKEGR